MIKDDHLIFEAYNYKKAMQSNKARVKKKGIGGAMDAASQRMKQSIKDEPLNSLEKNPSSENAEGPEKLKYDYEWATAFLPRDIDISNKAGQDKVLSLAYNEVLKRLVKDRKNPELAARNMFYDEDFPMEVVSQYAHYQEHGFPNVEDDLKDKMPDSKGENAEDMSKSPFHYDPMTHLADAAHQIYKILKNNSDDEARPEHIEKMAEIILGPQSEYSSVEHYKKALSGVVELLNHHVVVSMNEGEETPEERKERVRRGWELNKQRWAKWKAENPEKAKLNAQRKAGLYDKKEENEEMPSNVFNKLKQHINKGPIQVKKASKELPYTHKYIHHLAKKDSREEHKEEDAEGGATSKVEQGKTILWGILNNYLESAYRGSFPEENIPYTEIANEIKSKILSANYLTRDDLIAAIEEWNEGAEESDGEWQPLDMEDLMNALGLEENAEGGICIEDLANKHGVSLDHMQDQLGKGIKVETEHTDNFDVATKIALDHLNEDPNYYTKLAKMEGQSENEERRIDPKCWKGYHKAGTKVKGGVRVNNCVKNS